MYICIINILPLIEGVMVDFHTQKTNINTTTPETKGSMLYNILNALVLHCQWCVLF